MIALRGDAGIGGSVGGPVGGLVDDLFRRAAGRMVSRLARVLGPGRLDLAEDAVQDALIRALQRWPYTGVPDRPEAWLFTVARNAARDRLRRAETGAEMYAELARLNEAPPEPPADASVDDELAMMFMCCHPDLPHAARVALTLKTVGGLSVDEIAAAFLVEPATVAQRLVRAKRQIADRRLALAVPEARELPSRLLALLDAIYLMFNEGYGAHGGENLVRVDLCAEAIRLARLLTAEPRTDRPDVRAVLALMLFNAARLPARIDSAGDLTLLADQDRARWDQRLLSEAFRQFEASLSGAEKSPFHVEAAIASVHAAAPTYADTDWPAILSLYDELAALRPSPVVALNRAIALAHVDGPRAGLAALDALDRDGALDAYHLLPAAQGALWLELAESARAAQCFARALTRPCSAPERRFLMRRQAECKA
ncbi:MAG: sigma-70 family RNA polymerase sigma factor [Rhodospirillaceae bacterium]|nr:sigma-70 family RNA polymerase sigma factor [Rhodospirillaceae bacterium]